MKPKCYLESVAVEVNLNIGELGAMVIKVVVTQVEVCVANVRSKLFAYFSSGFFFPEFHRVLHTGTHARQDFR